MRGFALEGLEIFSNFAMPGLERFRKKFRNLINCKSKIYGYI